MLEEVRETARRKAQAARLARGALGSVARFMREEVRRGTLVDNLKALPRGGMAHDMSWAELLEEQAAKQREKPMLLFKDEVHSYRSMDQHANQVAHFLLANGGGKGKGVAIFMRNSPRFLDVFFAAQKIGMYVVPVNSELRGDGLAYVLNHSDVSMLAVDAELLEYYLTVEKDVENVRSVVVDDVEEEARGHAIPEGMLRLGEAYDPANPTTNPGVGYDRDAKCLILYTSGTTGPPKGVVYTYDSTKVKLLSIVAGITLYPDDVYYTALALCHGNALFLTTTLSMAVGATVALSRRFSASRFWDDIRRYDVTVFNTIGSIIPILMKQPERPDDRDNKVRYVLSAACPADMWAAFEKRFGVRIYEGYGAVDSAGKGILNLGTGPVGSIGKPSAMGKAKVVDENGNECPAEVPGELIFYVGDKAGGVAYYKNEEASRKKNRDGWMYTGDIVRKDEKGYLYFVGRNTESMRRGGENVSAYEVEHVIMKHPGVEDVAVYAVPSELAEDEIMASVKLVDGAKLTEKDLWLFLGDKLAKFAVPRYIRFVESFPMTQTHRIIKGELEKLGITDDTFDAKKA
ncbi:MAG: AMP-binding protein [Desulfatibacillaceae bacterium]